MVLRQKVWIDSHVQGVLIGRILLYWACGVLYVGLGSACFQYNQHPDWPVTQHAAVLFSQFWPWLPSAVLCLPLIVFDVIRLSNLFVGPIYRLRQHLTELNNNPDCSRLKFRDEDYWQDLAEPVHCLQAELQALRSEVAQLRKQTGNKSGGRDVAVGATIAEQVAQLAALSMAQRPQQPPKKILPAMGALVEPAT